VSPPARATTSVRTIASSTPSAANAFTGLASRSDSLTTPGQSMTAQATIAAIL
jgi:hypothetical protein